MESSESSHLLNTTLNRCYIYGLSTCLINPLQTLLICCICKQWLQDCHAGPCNHFFCKKCIVDHLYDSCDCPICYLPLWKKDLQRCPVTENITRNLERIATWIQSSFNTSNHDASTIQFNSQLITQLMKDNNCRLESNLTDVKMDGTHHVEIFECDLPKNNSSDVIFSIPIPDEKTILEKLSISKKLERILEKMIELSNPVISTHVHANTQESDSIENENHPENTLKILNSIDTAIYTVPQVSNLATSSESHLQTIITHDVKLDKPNLLPLQNIGTKRSFDKFNFKSSNSDPSQQIMENQDSIEVKKIYRTEYDTALKQEKNDETDHVSNLELKRSKRHFILGTALTVANKKIIVDAVKKLGGTLLRNFSKNTTHLVLETDSNCIATSRTVKYMQALLCGKWIISFRWIFDSLNSGQWLNEEKYEVQGDKFSTGGPIRARKAKSIQNPAVEQLQLFSKMVFCLDASPLSSQVPSIQDLECLVNLSGGVTLNKTVFLRLRDESYLQISRAKFNTTFKANGSKSPNILSYVNQTSQKIVIYDPTTLTKEDALTFESMYSWCSVAPVKWFLDCISSYSVIPIPKKVLFS